MVLKKVDEFLRCKCDYVDAIDDGIREILDGMVNFCKTNTKPQTLALAANQVGINKRLIVIFDNSEVLRLVNPKIVVQKGRQVFLEGCVSVSSSDGYLGGFVERPSYVKIEAFDYNGEEVQLETDGILAVMLCHEIDHLDGILYTDKLVGELLSFDTVEERVEYRKKHPLTVIQEHGVLSFNMNKVVKKAFN